MLQEVHLPNDVTIDKLQSKNSRFFLNGGTDHSSGVALNIPVPDTQILTYSDSSINRHEFNSRIITCRISWCNQPITLVNIYAPATSVAARCEFFSELKAKLQELSGPFIIGGDFNCVLQPELDLVNYNPKTHSSHKDDQQLLLDITIEHNLHDLWRKLHPNDIVGTYGRGQFKVNKQSRIDRFYVSESLLPLIESCRIEFDDSSDHYPISLTLLSPTECQVYKPSWRLNAHLLSNPGYIDRTRDYLKRFIQNNPEVTIESYERLKKILQAQAKQCIIGLRTNTKKTISMMRDQLETLVLTQNSPEVKASPYLTLRVNTEIHETIKSIKEKELFLNSSTFKTIELNRAEQHEEMTKYFFKSPIPKQYRTVMTSVQYKGETHRLQQDKSEAACDFYETLYSERSTSAPAQRQLLQTIQNGFQESSADYQDMNRPITPDEITPILSKLPKAKAPGPDGLICEFFTTFKDEFSIILSKLFNHCLEKDQIPPQMQDANIHLIFKKGATDNLANWRPISLLNTDYKVLSTLLNNRIKPYLPNLIHSDQKGFIPTRKLDDAVLKTIHLINYCVRENIPAYLLFLDQEKAFDRVDRQYLFKVLEAFNFPPLIINMIKQIYAKTSARISINNQLSKKFDLLSGVRQGCPLSPTLFALCIEPLANLVRRHKQIKGLVYPNLTDPLKVSMFADDTFFIIKDQKDLDSVLQSVATYEKATGALANKSKTEILPIGPNTHSTTNKLRTDITILSHDSEVRLLGATISNNNTSQNVWSKVNQRIIASLKQWSNINLSVRGRILIAKTVILPVIQFQCKFHTIPTKIETQFQRLIWNFIKRNDSRLVSLETAQLPHILGGLDAPNIKALYHSTRLRWFKELFSPTNNAEWKVMALHEFDVISKNPGMGTEILLHPDLLPKIKRSDFWKENLSVFHKCGGQYTPPNEDSQRPTASYINSFPLKLLDQDTKTFATKGITQLSQFVDTIQPDGTIIPLTHSQFKIKHQLQRNVNKRHFDSICSLLPEKVVPPLFFTTLDNSEIFALDLDSSEPVAKRLKPTQYQSNTYEPAGEPPVPIEDISKLVELDHSYSMAQYEKIEGVKDHSKARTIKAAHITLNINDTTIPLPNVSLSSISQAHSKKHSTKHKHSNIWDGVLGSDFDFSKYPNRRQHPALPKYLYNVRYSTLHNKHWIGDRLKYLPDSKPEDLLCKFCNLPNSITHLIVECNHIIPLWEELKKIYYEILVGIPDEDLTHIRKQHLFFGAPTITTKSPIKRLQLHLLDIMTGNMQLAIFTNHNLSRRNNSTPSIQALKQIFHFNMSRTINTIINASNKKRSRSTWIFQSNSRLPKCDLKTWIGSFRALLSDSFQVLQDNN